MSYIYKQIFDAEQCKDIFEYLRHKNYEYHKPFKRFNKPVKVPRGQASYTLDDTIHYNYGVSGGSPENEIMDDKLVDITRTVNEALGTNYNTILMNVYKNGNDYISQHQDKETGWADGTDFSTVAFGNPRHFVLVNKNSGNRHKILHEQGYAIQLPPPMNRDWTHGIPKAGRTVGMRISLTFREIKPAAAATTQQTTT